MDKQESAVHIDPQGECSGAESLLSTLRGNLVFLSNHYAEASQQNRTKPGGLGASALRYSKEVQKGGYTGGVE